MYEMHGIFNHISQEMQCDYERFPSQQIHGSAHHGRATYFAASRYFQQENTSISSSRENPQRRSQDDSRENGFLGRVTMAAVIFLPKLKFEAAVSQNVIHSLSTLFTGLSCSAWVPMMQ
jgi:hypothetical protein